MRKRVVLFVAFAVFAMILCFLLAACVGVANTVGRDEEQINAENRPSQDGEGETNQGNEHIVIGETVRLSLITNMPEAGTITGGGVYQHNSEVDLCAHPNPGYRFVCWKYQQFVVSNQSEYKYKMWDTEVTLEAVFAYENYILKVETNNKEKGEITVANKSTIEKLENWAPWYDEKWSGSCEYMQEFIVAANTKSDARFLGWFDQNEMLVSTNAIYSFAMPSSDYKLTAKWNYFTISYNLDGGEQNSANPSWYQVETPEIILRAPSMGGETFCGWACDNQPIEKIDTKLGRNLVIDAKWTIINKYIGTEKDVVIGDWVNTIGENAFANREDITSVAIPNSVTRIGDGAFAGCSELTSVSIGQNVIDIGESAFAKCTSLESIIIPNKVNRIGVDAFCECEALSAVSIGNNVTVICDGAFRLCTNITAIKIPDSVRQLGDTALGGCTALQQVDIGQNVESIGNYAFANCFLLKRIELPAHLLGIGEGAFYGCCEISSFDVPNTVNSIGCGAFEGCVALKEISVPFVGGNKTFDSLSPASVFGFIFGYGDGGAVQQNWDVTHSLFYHIPANLRSVTVRGGRIAYGAFQNCYMLVTIDVQSCTSEIGARAFSECRGLTSMSMPAGVTTLGEDAYLGCSCMESITLPASVTAIESRAFEGCRDLKISGSAEITAFVAKNCDAVTGIEITSGASIKDNTFNNLYLFCIIYDSYIFFIT